MIKWKSDYQMEDREYHAWLGYMYYTSIVVKLADKDDCYGCETQRHSCSHDESDDYEEEYEENLN